MVLDRRWVLEPKLFHHLLEQGRREGAIGAKTSPDLAVAMLVGTLGQVARMAYFKEIAPPLRAHAEKLSQLFLQALGAEKERKQ